MTATLTPPAHQSQPARRDYNEPDCWPHPFDIMAVTALYQTHDITPSAPRNVQADATHNTVTLTWNPPTKGDVEGYRILRRAVPGGGFREIVAHTRDTATSYIDRNVERGTRYFYQVQAIAVKGHTRGELSSIVIIRTQVSP